VDPSTSLLATSLLATSLLALSGMHILMAMVPGPNTVVVSHFSASISRRAGLTAMAGIVLASLLWVALSLAGIGVLLLEAGWLYRTLRLVGAAYLVYVGIRLLLSARHARPPGSATSRLGRAPFAAGLLTTLSNPKSAVFWTSVFAVAVPPQAPAWFYAAVLGIIAIQSALWYSAVALLLSTGLARRHYTRCARWLDGIAGAVMVALGLHLGDTVRHELTGQASA